MRIIRFIVLFFSVLVSGYAQELRHDFPNPDFSYGPWTWWHWMNGNVSKEGIRLDLQAMHDNGISGVVLFSGNAGIPAGDVRYGSPEWMDCVKLVFEEAERLGMQVMLHNGPGYSVTGGPWIRPEHSMQQLVWTEAVIKKEDPRSRIQLKQPYAKLGYYEDAMVVAYPSLKGEDHPMTEVVRSLTVNGQPVSFEPLLNADYDTFVSVDVPAGQKQGQLVLECKEEIEVSSMVLRRAHTGPPHHPYDGPRDDPPTLQLQYSRDGSQWVDLCRIAMPALRALNVPTSSNFPSARARFFRLISNKPTRLTELHLFAAPRLPDWESKANFLTKGNRAANYASVEYDTNEVIDPETVIDLTAMMQPDGTLNWQAPEGDWTILRFGHTTTGETNAAAPIGGVGLECDKLSKQGIQAHYEGSLKAIFEEMKAYRGSSFVGLAVDSWEAGSQNWTKDFDQTYTRHYQRRILPYMAAFTGRIVGSSQETELFLENVRRLQARMLAENYHQEMRNLCHQHDLIFLNEPYGDGPFNSMEVAQYIDIPAGEFWVHSLYGGSHTNNQAGYIARTEGKKIAAAEAFTAMPDLSRFTEYPAAMKGEGDWMFCNGINRFMYHTFAHQPHPTAKPGMTMGPFGTHFNRNQTWWKLSKVYIDYVRRCQFLLQQGRFVSNNSAWIPAGHTVDPTQQAGDFAYKAGNPNAIINYIHRQHGDTDFYFVSNNKRAPEFIEAEFAVEGKQPELWYPETGVQHKLTTFRVENGKTIVPLNLKASESVFVVFSERLSQESPDRIIADDPTWMHTKAIPVDYTNSFTMTVWLRPDVIAKGGRSYVLFPQSGSSLYGIGHATVGLAVGQNGIRVFEKSGDREESVLNLECTLEGWSMISLVYEDGIPMLYINGKKQKEGLKSSYTVHSNSIEINTHEPVVTLFQGEYLTPSWTDAVLSSREIASLYKRGKPGKSMYVVDNVVYAGQQMDVIPIKANWEVCFPKDSGAPEQIRMSGLKSLHLHSNEGVRYFSGTAHYRTEVKIPEKAIADAKRVLLDLGNVAFVAALRVNGMPLDTLWKPPYEMDITDVVRVGTNQIEVIVSNLWTNRLIGDARLAPSNAYDQWGELKQLPGWYQRQEPFTGKPQTFVAWKQYDSNGPLTESGLIGPVQWVIIHKNK